MAAEPQAPIEAPPKSSFTSPSPSPSPSFFGAHHFAFYLYPPSLFPPRFPNGNCSPPSPPSASAVLCAQQQQQQTSPPHHGYPFIYLHYVHQVGPTQPPLFLSLVGTPRISPQVGPDEGVTMQPLAPPVITYIFRVLSPKGYEYEALLSLGTSFMTLTSRHLYWKTSFDTESPERS
ncbi:hypothetical protein B296_00005874 [Ensete ventricosum]|uniref:Uncharacterized protein n=1 Tax=Ensete ventricosum TaxID=4639 RepID=A0A427AM08_ENSVE|nr:hypothetical protein B296_00005874 [Ensete ventricosum]